MSASPEAKSSFGANFRSTSFKGPRSSSADVLSPNEVDRIIGCFEHPSASPRLARIVIEKTGVIPRKMKGLLFSGRPPFSRRHKSGNSPVQPALGGGRQMPFRMATRASRSARAVPFPMPKWSSQPPPIPRRIPAIFSSVRGHVGETPAVLANGFRPEHGGASSGESNGGEQHAARKGEVCFAQRRRPDESMQMEWTLPWMRRPGYMVKPRSVWLRIPLTALAVCRASWRVIGQRYWGGRCARRRKNSKSSAVYLPAPSHQDDRSG